MTANIVWIALGAMLGLAAWKLSRSHARLHLIENVLVGVYGAIIGAEALAPSMLGKSAAVNGMQLSIMSVAIFTAALALLTLHRFRNRMAAQQPRKRRHRA
jgi:uncharacterized membrane protein YeaQ/YmgE (transglycosylase-associated protein family)